MLGEEACTGAQINLPAREMQGFSIALKLVLYLRRNCVLQSWRYVLL